MKLGQFVYLIDETTRIVVQQDEDPTTVKRVTFDSRTNTLTIATEERNE